MGMRGNAANRGVMHIRDNTIQNFVCNITEDSRCLDEVQAPIVRKVPADPSMKVN
jgi:hypothetical protein